MLCRLRQVDLLAFDNIYSVSMLLLELHREELFQLKTRQGILYCGELLCYYESEMVFLFVVFHALHVKVSLLMTEMPICKAI